jgi:hypothetical protein
MTRIQQILGAVLAAQIIAAAILFWPQPAAEQAQPLFGEIDADQITAFSIDDGTGNSLAFERMENDWVVSETDGYPANSEKINELLGKIVEVSTGRMVASNPDSYARLQVGEDSYMRRLWFKDNSGTDYVLFAGSTVGAGATHIRKDGDREVYLTDKVSGWQLGTQAQNWMDVIYVTIPREQMQRVTIENASGKLEFVNEREGETDNWVMLNLEEGEEFNPNNLVSMLTRFTNLQFNRPLGTEELPAFGMDAPKAVVTLDYTDEEGSPKTLILRIGTLDEGEKNFYAHASTSEQYVKIPKFSLNDFVERTKEVFLVTEASEEG